MSSVYDFSAQTIDGKTRTLADYKGKVLLVVNTASKCGFTPQYKGLEALHKKYSARGFAVLGFPSNQFLSQEPGSESEKKGLLGSEGIKWNFTKFLVGKDGTVIDRYAPTTKPEDLEKDVERALAA